MHQIPVLAPPLKRAEALRASCEWLVGMERTHPPPVPASSQDGGWYDLRKMSL